MNLVIEYICVEIDWNRFGLWMCMIDYCDVINKLIRFVCIIYVLFYEMKKSFGGIFFNGF